MRLTEWRGEHAAIVNHHENYIDKLATYEDIGLSPEEIKLNMDGLDEYHKVEAEGRLMILPCRVGNVVYRIHTKDHIVKNCIIAFHVSASGIWYWDETGRETSVETIGKTVFLTLTEAEAALKGEGKADV